MIDWTLNLSALLSAGVVLAGGVAFAVATRSRLESFAERMLAVEEQLKQLVMILIQQGRQDERLAAMQATLLAQGQRLDDLTKRFMRWANGHIEPPLPPK